MRTDKTPYICDPVKNKRCNHKNCAIFRRGTCAITFARECAVDDLEDEYRKIIRKLVWLETRTARGSETREAISRARALLEIYHRDRKEGERNG